MDLWIFLLIRFVTAFPTTWAPTTQANHFKRGIPDSSACTSCNYFIGYMSIDSTWITIDCNPGQFFTLLDPCISSTASKAYHVSNAYCEGTSVIVAPGTVVWTCGSPQSYCITVLLYPNLDLGVATTMIECHQNAVTITYFRETTRGVPSATASTTFPFPTSSTTGDVPNSLGFGLTVFNNTQSVFEPNLTSVTE